MSKRRSERRAARRRHPSSQFVDDGCPVCVALRHGDDLAALDALYRQPEADGHRVLVESDGTVEFVRLLAHGSEWTAPLAVVEDAAGAVTCPECDDPVRVW